MASDAALRPMDFTNPCCALWKSRYSKIEEKRHALRQGVEILKGQIDRLQQENLNLKKAYDEEQARANVLEEEKRKETSLRISMEKEIATLKSQISSSKDEAVSQNEDLNKDVTLLRICLSERESEMDRLQQCLSKEGRRIDAEKQHADLERTKAAKLEEALECEKRRADEERKRDDAMENEIVALKSELSSSKDEVISQNEDLNKEVTLLHTCLSERHVEIDRLQQRLTEEGRRVDAEKKNAALERRKATELQEALEYEKSKADEARKMADAMEKEIGALKSDVSSHGPEVKSGVEDLHKEVTLLRACISERELETNRLKQLLMEEERKADAERQRADLERKKAVELQEALASEKSRAEEVSKMADAMGKKAEENMVQLEAFKNEVDKTRLKFEEAKKKVEAEKQKTNKEKRRADEEKARVIEQRRIAEANEMKLAEENSRANNLLLQLEEKQQNVDKLQKELQEVMSSQKCAFSSELDEVKRKLEAEKKKYAKENKHADHEMSKRDEQQKVAEASTKKAVEEKQRADKLSQELRSSRQRVECLEKQLHEVKNMLEAERKRASGEEKRADAEKLKSDEQERIAAENGRIAVEEKIQADNLCQELENNRRKLQEMENELNELRSREKLAKASNVAPVVTKEQTSKLHFLQKQLKFEKQRVKLAKEVAELEKDRNIILQQEIFSVRQGVECLLHHLDVLTDIGARNGANNVSKKSRLSDVDTGLLSGRMLTSHSYLCGDAEFRMSCLSSRDASCHFKENEGFVPARRSMESPSGMETELDLLLGGSHGETLRSSALNLNTASFSDEQLVGSQERVARSLTTSAILAAENTNLQTTISKCSNECCKRKDGEKVGIVAENSTRSPFKTPAGHAIKKRKILDELDSIKSMQSKGQRIFQEMEKKLCALQSTLVEPMIEQREKENCQLPVCMVNSLSNYDQFTKKRKASHEPKATCLHIDDSSVAAEVEKHGVAPTSKGPENSQVLQDASKDIVRCNQDVSSFEELMNEDYMKLLNLENAVDEECFRTAMERPVSPTLPEIDLCSSETCIDAEMLSMHASKSHEAGDQHGGFMHDKNKLYCIVFSDMEDNSTINRILCAVTNCLAQCCLFLHANWLVHDILAALGLEKDLRPREKVCSLFSLILLNFSEVSARKFGDLQDKELLKSFRAHIHSVLSGVDARSQFAEICQINDLISLFEDLVLRRRILLQGDAASGSLHDSSLSFEILHEGKKFVLSPDVASIDLVLAGSITLGSICTAIGQIGDICEVSFNILRMCGTENQMMLRILHMFAYVCGQEYLSSSSYSFMRAVKSVITLVEHSYLNIAGMDIQSGNDMEPHFIPCVRCPFSEGSLSLDDVCAMLLEALHNYCSKPGVPKDPAAQAHLSTTGPLFCNLGDVLSSLELIASNMSWNWACNKIIPKLLKMLELCDRGRGPSTALIALLGELGRLGVKERGYDDVGVESIRCQLSDILCYDDISKCNAFAVAVVSALVRLHPKGCEEFVNINLELSSKIEGHPASAASKILRSCLSSLNGEQISYLFGLENPLVV